MGVQLPNNSLALQRVHIAKASRVGNRMQLPVAVSDRRGVCTGMYCGKHLWFKYGAYTSVATQVASPVYAVVHSGYQLGDD